MTDLITTINELLGNPPADFEWLVYVLAAFFLVLGVHLVMDFFRMLFHKFIS